MASFTATSEVSSHVDLQYLFHHIALPPKLPQENDETQDSQNCLLDTLLVEAIKFEHFLPADDKIPWSQVVNTLNHANSAHDGVALTQSVVADSLKSLQSEGGLIFYIAAQNAGLLILRRDAENVIIESFEASAPTKTVIEAESALRWNFPGPAVSIPLVTFQDDAFQTEFAGTISALNQEFVNEVMPQSSFGGVKVVEIRDTVDPKLVTNMLMPLLQVNGTAVTSQITTKRIRDDVLWDEALGPWRRSSLWLVLRVGIQRLLTSWHDSQKGLKLYKTFMAFFLARICNIMIETPGIPAENLAFIRTKLARRLFKLREASSLKPFEETFASTLETVNEKLGKTWFAIRKSNDKVIGKLPTCTNAADTVLSLKNSRAYLKKALLELDFQKMATAFQPEPNVRLIIDHLGLISFPKTLLSGFNQKLALADVEAWVKTDLPAWKSHRNPTEEYILGIARLLTTYNKIASTSYAKNPELMSKMLLTIFELWVTLDEFTVATFHMLSEYEHGIPLNILEPLLLLNFEDMCRVHKIETYLKERNRQSRKGLPGIFSELSDRSFSSRFFDQSPRMQACEDELIKLGESQKREKTEEWQQKKSRHDELTRARSSRMTCEYIYERMYDGNIRGYRDVEKHYESHCNKCMLLAQIQKIEQSFQINEFPLQNQAKGVVFELCCPPSFAAWREATWIILNDLGRAQPIPGRSPNQHLRKYTPFTTRGTIAESRLSLASVRKSFLKSHYKQTRAGFPDLKDICVPNPLQFSLYDTMNNIWTAQQIDTPDLTRLCCTLLPFDSAYSTLQFSVDSTLHTSNQIMACASQCPKDLTLHEFTAFQEIRCGHRLTWYNIVRELASVNLDFNAEAVGILIKQATLQNGPSSNKTPLRETHCVFEETLFCQKLAEHIQCRLLKIMDNWQEQNCMRTMIVLLLRFKALHRTTSLPGALLLQARIATVHWMRTLSQELKNCEVAEKTTDWSHQLLGAAMLCRKTFTLDASNDFAFTDNDLSCFLECAITIASNKPLNPTDLPKTLQDDLQIDCTISHDLEKKIRNSIKSKNSAITQVINQVWPGIRSFEEWKFLPAPRDRWLTSRTLVQNGSSSQVVHLNILDGTLFVNGKPRGKLPQNYTNHATYRQLLGSKILEIYPSDKYGLLYKSTGIIYGWEVHFGWRNQNGGQLIIRAYNGDQTLELIPYSFFLGAFGPVDLPMSMISKCTHWLDLKKEVLEIRPEVTKWTTNSHENWFICLKTFTARRGTDRLVDMGSQLFAAVAQVITPFETQENMVVFESQKRGICLNLPRFKLDFYVNPEQVLESVELKAIVDNDQDIGTFYGLTTKLVLSSTTATQSRSIVIPRGKILVAQSQDGHVAVSIMKEGETLSYCRYVINLDLYRLDCPYSSDDIYRKIYLHAVTSFVLPDPLTGRRGTEEALATLKSAIATPWSPVDDDSIDALYSIASLTPRRRYYPPHLEVMQSVHWSSALPAHIQHDDFLPLVKTIVEQSNELSKFWSRMAPSSAFQSLLEYVNESSDIHLLKRAQLINSVYRHPDYTSNQVNPKMDSHYNSRAVWIKNDASQNIREIAFMIQQWSPKIPYVGRFQSQFNKIQNIVGFSQNYAEDSVAKKLKANLDEHWCPLFKTCQSSNKNDRYRLMFLLSMIGYGNNFDINLLKILGTVAISDEVKTLELPAAPCFKDFCEGEIPNMGELAKSIHPHCRSFPFDNELTNRRINPLRRQELTRMASSHQGKVETACQSFAKHLFMQWPCANPNLAGFDKVEVLDERSALITVGVEWERIYQNLEFSKYLKALQHLLEKYQISETELITDWSTPEFKEKSVVPSHNYSIPFTLATIAETFCTNLDYKLTPMTPIQPSTPAQPNWEKLNELENLIQPMMSAPNTVQRQYVKDLNTSVKALKDLWENIVLPKTMPIDRYEAISASDLDHEVNARFSALKDSMEYKQPSKWLLLGDLWPRITPSTLLELIGSHNKVQLQPSLKNLILNYGVCVTTFQRARRLEFFLRKNKVVQYEQELLNHGHTWDVSLYPDWLLLEIELDLMIRTEQVQVAQAMMKPQSGSNAVLQLNMGKGKSSVIVPMITAALANSENCVRVIVPRPLLQQSCQLLAARLGQLLNRRICHVPFSRETPTNEYTVNAYAKIHREVSSSRGVMVSLHENILSFELMGIERLSNDSIHEAKNLLSTQTWLENNCRDILDESDHTLAVRTQLIYPLGIQSHVDGAPNRWKIIEKVLKITSHQMIKVVAKFPEHAKLIEQCEGGFPFIFLLNEEVEDRLLDLITDVIINTETEFLPLHLCNSKTRECVASVIREKIGITEQYANVEESFEINSTPKNTVLLLRGLLAFRILIQALKKRWNVQYGKHPSRCLMAVPFRAKGIHSEFADFAHTDVAILLTCLNYYYSGLDRIEFRKCMEEVLRQVDPSYEYDQWCKNSKGLPQTLHAWNAINLEDGRQFEILFSNLRFIVEVINFYLNAFVFPREVRQFQKKLSACAWDIPRFRSKLVQDQKGIKREDEARQDHEFGLTTGFSGTNDNRSLLPMNITQVDLNGLTHTNAEVLVCLLEDRNRRVLHQKNELGERLSVHEFVKYVAQQKPRIQMILDAGAQVLEIDNEVVAHLWLLEESSAPAVVYFDRGDRLVVLYRDGRKTSLSASPYADDIATCLVYLDESHTRGTDLKVPSEARAILTLGLGQTKDATTQAAMRLRQLAYTQSVVFYAPPEVHQSILDLTSKRHEDILNSSDVIFWLLYQSASSIQSLQPLYISQGENYCMRMQATLNYQDDGNTNRKNRGKYLMRVEQSDIYMLSDLYAPRDETIFTVPKFGTCTILNSYLQKLQDMRKNLVEEFLPIQAEEEQERELEAENERETEIERPPIALPLEHHLQPEVSDFALNGNFEALCGVFFRAFLSLKNLALFNNMELRVTDMPLNPLYVTKDFTNTIVSTRTKSADDYIRPVRWLLFNTRINTGVIISPYEANELLPRMREITKPETHLLIYSAPVVRSMIPFDKLDFSIPALPTDWTPPSWLVRDLGIFAGRLYFTYEEYIPLCQFLGISGWQSIRRDVFLKSPSNSLAFLRDWLMLRRKEQDFTSTPMGYVVNSLPLRKEHPFFAK